ncbi:MAG: hypothetical protein COA45_05920 [Zetaproteobacteria bacterium]|nr:MAG: hypothetical protein COA45_05920 [Zetaproteobacteria bacterium]
MGTIALLPNHPDYIASENEKDLFFDACMQTFEKTLHKRNQDRGAIPADTVSIDTLIQTENSLDKAYENLEMAFKKAHRAIPEEQENMYQIQKNLISDYTNDTPT